MTALTVVFDARLPHARWGPLFHVFCLEQPDITLDWRPVGFPQSDRPLLDGADVACSFSHRTTTVCARSCSMRAPWSSSWRWATH
jgi:hypothetical protein